MIAAAREAGVRLLVGHSHSFDAPIARARELIASGVYGPLRMATALNFTDFLYRPRRPEELDTERGGGVIFNQAPHHVDVLRLLGGGRLASVRAAVGRWDARRPTEGAYAAFFTFEDGAAASLAYSGYGHFDSDALCDWISEAGRAKDPAAYGAARRALYAKQANSDEVALKTARLYGGPLFKANDGDRVGHQHFGFLVASCDKADLRPTPTGVAIYADDAATFERCPLSEIPRREVIDELHAAIVGDRPPRHDGEWGLATMEACHAILISARESREVKLVHQCGLRDG
jgi:phthalate 4,5-cis-dihydrodiol dehydrogenase